MVLDPRAAPLPPCSPPARVDVIYDVVRGRLFVIGAFPDPNATSVATGALLRCSVGGWGAPAAGAVPASAGRRGLGRPPLLVCPRRLLSPRHLLAALPQ